MQNLPELLCQPLSECGGVFFSVEELRPDEGFIVDWTLYPEHQLWVCILPGCHLFLLHHRDRAACCVESKVYVSPVMIISPSLLSLSLSLPVYPHSFNCSNVNVSALPFSAQRTREDKIGVIPTGLTLGSLRASDGNQLDLCVLCIFVLIRELDLQGYHLRKCFI